MNSEVRKCQNCHRQFSIEPDDFAFYKKIKAPPPTWCPECRMIRRFSQHNMRTLFRRKCDATGKEILSGIPPQAPLKVFERDYWWTDAWDSMDYGRDYDFSRSFFEQFKELLYSVPWPSRNILQLINADYCNNSGFLKNVYLSFNTGYSEDSAYLMSSLRARDSLDLYEAEHDELCYDSVMIDDCFQTFFSLDCDNCTDVWFSKDMTGCTNCFGCVGLRSKSYYIFNQPYAKEDYFEKIKSFDLGSFQKVAEFLEKSHDLWSRFPVKCMHGSQNTNASGEHIQNSKNVYGSYLIHDGENIKYSQMLFLKTADCWDYTSWGEGSSFMYEALDSGLQCHRIKFCYEAWPSSHDLEYCIYCHTTSDLFGCVGLRNKQYCILNKQYSQEDYFALREKIIQQMNEMPYIDKLGRIYKYGEFFPTELSPFAYNETMAQDFFPLTQKETEKKGYLWRDQETREYETTINASDFPDHIKDVDESVLKEIIKCSSCHKAYRIIQMELDFLKRVGLPLPRLCPNCRFMRRFQFVNPPKFWLRKCQCAGSVDDRKIYQNQTAHFHGSSHCPNEFETSYAPERPEIVYCEGCYNNEVV